MSKWEPGKVLIKPALLQSAPEARQWCREGPRAARAWLLTAVFVASVFWVRVWAERGMLLTAIFVALVCC